jgi:hypothetical protein
MDRREHHPKSFKAPHIHIMKLNQALVTRAQGPKKKAAKTNGLNLCITISFLLASQRTIYMQDDVPVGSSYTAVPFFGRAGRALQQAGRQTWTQDYAVNTDSTE